MSDENQVAGDPAVAQEVVEEAQPEASAPIDLATVVEDLTNRLQLAEELLELHEKYLMTTPEYKFFMVRHTDF